MFDHLYYYFKLLFDHIYKFPYLSHSIYVENKYKKYI